jgi:hypothetical protein
VKELLGQAVDALVGTESGWHSSEVSKFNVLVKVLFSLVSDPLSFSADDARREYEAEVYRTEQAPEDRLAMTFISNAADAFRGFQSDPDTELTRDRLGIALNALAKIPVIGPDVADAARPEIGKNVRLTLEGPVRTWAHRSLGSIGNESGIETCAVAPSSRYIAPICADTAWSDRIRQRHRCARRRRRRLRSLSLPSKVRGDEHAEMAGGSRRA